MGSREADNPGPVKSVIQSAFTLGYSAATGTAACAGALLTSVTAAVSKADQAIRLHGTQAIKEAAESVFGLGIQVPQKIKNAVADPDCRDRIGRTAWKLGDHVLSEVTKPYTGGLPVYRVVMEGLTKAPSGKAAHDDSFGKRLERLEAKVGMLEAKGNPQSSKKEAKGNPQSSKMEAKGNPQSSKKEAKGNPQSSKKVGGSRG